MTDIDLVKMLWDASNVVTGFAAVQAFGFSYACAKKDFGDAINTRRAKVMIFASMSIMNLGYCLALLWCARQEAGLDAVHAAVYWQAAIARILFIFAVSAFSFIALWARQIFSGEPYRGSR